MMRFLTLLLLAACEAPKIVDSSDTSEPFDSSDTSGYTDTTPTPRTLTATITGYALPRRDQVYDIGALPSAGPGCVAIGNPVKKWYLQTITPRLKKFEVDHLNRYDLVIGITERDVEHFRRLGLRKPGLISRATRKLGNARKT